MALDLDVDHERKWRNNRESSSLSFPTITKCMPMMVIHYLSLPFVVGPRKKNTIYEKDLQPLLVCKCFWP